MSVRLLAIYGQVWLPATFTHHSDMIVSFVSHNGSHSTKSPCRFGLLVRRTGLIPVFLRFIGTGGLVGFTMRFRSFQPPSVMVLLSFGGQPKVFIFRPRPDNGFLWQCPSALTLTVDSFLSPVPAVTDRSMAFTPVSQRLYHGIHATSAR